LKHIFVHFATMNRMAGSTFSLSLRTMQPNNLRKCPPSLPTTVTTPDSLEISKLYHPQNLTLPLLMSLHLIFMKSTNVSSIIFSVLRITGLNTMTPNTSCKVPVLGRWVFRVLSECLLILGAT
jgi:hypothetical protein